MGFNGVELAIGDLLSRLANPSDRLTLAPILEAADRELGADGKTSELEARDYLERNPAVVTSATGPVVEAGLRILASAEQPADVSANAQVFVHVRSTLARITHELEDFESMRDPGPSRAQAQAITKLETELAHTVSTARTLAQMPGYAAIAGHANAAIVRIATYRAYGMFADTTFRTPLPLESSPEGTLASARIELAGMRAAAQHLSGTAYTVVKGTPAQVTQLVDNLYRIRDSLEALRPHSGPVPRELAALYADYNATLRLAAGTTYSWLTRNTTVAVGRVSDLELPAPLVTAS